MGCEDCSAAAKAGAAYPYRWHAATLELTGCAKHVREAADALSEAQKVNTKYHRSSETRDVLEFMMKFNHVFTTGQGVPLHEHSTLNRPRWLTPRLGAERAEKMLEEVREFKDANEVRDLGSMADALVDLVYFAKGTAILMGLPWEELWADVHRANMEKERGPKVRNGVVHLVDAVKPTNWRGPQTMAVLTAAGYELAAPGGEWDHPEHLPQASLTSEVKP